MFAAGDAKTTRSTQAVVRCAVLLKHVHVCFQIQAASGHVKYAGPMDCVKQLYRENGIRGIYKGTALTLMRGTDRSAFTLLTHLNSVKADLRSEQM